MRQEEAAIVKHVVGPLLSAVGAMHAAGVIHRDLKPENILLQGSHILVTDFGFATLTHDTARRPVTRLGTLHFMAPEVILNDVHDPVSFRDRIPRVDRYRGKDSAPTIQAPNTGSSVGGESFPRPHSLR